MIKLQLINVVNGKNHTINADSDISESDARNITNVILKRRNEGVGGGFKGRAPNRAMVYFGPRRWNAVVLPDDYNIDSVKSVTIFDSKKQMEPIQLEQSDKTPSNWEVPQRPVSEAYARTGAGVQGPQPGQSGSRRIYEIEESFKTQFDFIGGVGVNDLQHAIAVTIQIPYTERTQENEDALWGLADQLASKYGVDVALNFSTIGAPAAGHKLVGAGNIGETPYPQHAMAGRQPIAPVGPGTHDPTDSATAVKPFTPGWEGPGREQPLEPGQAEEPYGSLGPQDQ